jgi:hypothetical protein
MTQKNISIKTFIAVILVFSFLSSLAQDQLILNFTKEVCITIIPECTFWEAGRLRI